MMPSPQQTLSGWWILGRARWCSMRQEFAFRLAVICERLLRLREVLFGGLGLGMRWRFIFCRIIPG